MCAGPFSGIICKSTMTKGIDTTLNDLYDDEPLLGVAGPDDETYRTKPVRSQILEEADRLINGDRNKAYGTPTQNFTNISEFWTTFLKHKLKDDQTITPADVANLMILLKVARGIAGNKMDTAVDGAGYFAILGEIFTLDEH